MYNVLFFLNGLSQPYFLNFIFNETVRIKINSKK